MFALYVSRTKVMVHCMVIVAVAEPFYKRLQYCIYEF